MNMQLHQVETLNKEIEARHARTSKCQIRNKWQRSQNTKNYQSDYDRIRSHMGNSVRPRETVQRINNRQTVLERLGAQTLNCMK